MEIELHKPSKPIFCVSLVFGLVAAIGWISTIPLLSAHATALALAAYGILALSNVVRA